MAKAGKGRRERTLSMCEVQRRSAEAPRWECAWHSRGAQGTRGPEQNEKSLGPRTEFLRFLGLKVVCRHLSLGVFSSQRRHLLETGLCRRFPHMLSCPEPQSCLGLDCYHYSRRAGRGRPCFFGIWLLGNLCPALPGPLCPCLWRAQGGSAACPM